MGEPCIALPQWDALPLFRNHPPQAQARDRALHFMNNRDSATIIIFERGRVDCNANVISVGSRHFSTNP